MESLKRERLGASFKTSSEVQILRGAWLYKEEAWHNKWKNVKVKGPLLKKLHEDLIFAFNS